MVLLLPCTLQISQEIWIGCKRGNCQNRKISLLLFNILSLWPFVKATQNRALGVLLMNVAVYPEVQVAFSILFKKSGKRSRKWWQLCFNATTGYFLLQCGVFKWPLCVSACQHRCSQFLKGLLAFSFYPLCCEMQTMLSILPMPYAEIVKVKTKPKENSFRNSQSYELSLLNVTAGLHPNSRKQTSNKSFP